MKRRWLVLSVVVLSLVVALPASTQQKSVMVNGDFEADVGDWTALGGTLTRTTTAPHGGTYAAQVETFVADGYGWVESPCIDLSAELADWPLGFEGKKYLTLDGYLKSDGVIDAALQIDFFETTDCLNQIGESKSSTGTTSDTWTFLSVTEDITDTASSVRVVLWGQTDPMADATFYADDLRVFSSSDYNAVQMQGLTGRGGLWGIGLVGVVLAGVVLARRRKTA